MPKPEDESETPPSTAAAVSANSRFRHDLLTPISHLLGYSEMLIEDLEDRAEEALAEKVRTIHAASKDAHFFIQQMFAAQEMTEENAGSLEVLLSAPMSIVREQVAAVRDLAGETLRTSIDPDLERIDQAAGRIFALLTGGEFAPDTPETPPRDRPPPAVSAEAPRMAGRILVVDDNPANREILTRRLHREGFEVGEAGGGRETLEILRSTAYDLLLLDVMMPDVDGFEVLRALKADPATRDIPIIMISALDEVEGAVRCMELGAEDFVTKPFDPVLLRARIGSSLDKKRMRDEERRSAERLRQALEAVLKERQRSESLLRNILPPAISDELSANGRVAPRFLDDVSIVFTDFVGFTLSTERLGADKLVELLHAYFTEFDHIVRRYKLEKLKTIGDSYMCIGGLERAGQSHPVDSVLACMEIVAAVERMRAENPVRWAVRVGLHTGPVVAGVVGIDKFAFDVWGETVNYSSRMEAGAEPGRINISERAYSRVKDFFDCEHRGKIATKDRRALDMYFVHRVRPELMSGIAGNPPPEFARRYYESFNSQPPSFPAFLLKDRQ